jgi:DNA-binding response OmpR family regulator
MADENNKIRILVVDDQPRVLAFIKIDLKLRGFSVSCAGSGEEALKKAREETPDIMLLDILMPGMSGFDVLKELRKFTQIPVIAFSASPENRELSIRAGATQFLNKPFDPDDMALKIEELAGKPMSDKAS